MTLDHFEGEDVIITFEQEGADKVTNFEGRITSYRRSGGTASTEEKFAFGSKTFNFQKPREKFTIELEYVTTNPDFANIQFGTVTNANVAGSTEIRSDSVPQRWRVICWFQTKSDHENTGSIVVPATGEIYRIIHIDCKSVTNDIDFAADDMLTGTLTFELSATDSDGYPNIIEEYDATSAGGLTTLGTTAHRGLLTWNTTTPAWSGNYRT